MTTPILPTDVAEAIANYQRSNRLCGEYDSDMLCKLLSVCGSAPEQLMLIDVATLALFRSRFGVGGFHILDDHITCLLISDVGLPVWIEIYPQMVISPRGFDHDVRVDFAIFVFTRTDNSEPSWEVQGRYGMRLLRSLVVEIDGYPYHDKTKEQSTRDKQRDRAISAMGFQVLRFSGQEIWRNGVEIAKLRARLYRELGDGTLPVVGPVADELWFEYIEPLLGQAGKKQKTVSFQELYELLIQQAHQS